MSSARGPSAGGTTRQVRATSLARRGRISTVVLCGLVLTVLVGPVASRQALAHALLPPSESATLDRRLLDDRITESSGLAVSQVQPDLLWTHNDSGDGPWLYGVDQTGAVTTTIFLTGVSATDWEAMSPGRDEEGNPALFVGDIGDNSTSRSEVVVHRVAEPSTTGHHDLAPTSFTLQYPDGPHDAEALLVHPESNRLFVVTKQAGEAAPVFAAPAMLDPWNVNVLQRVGSVSAYATDGAFTPDGRILLRTYLDVKLYDDFDADPQTIATPVTRQGESLAADPDGSSFLVGTEGSQSPVYRVAIPASPTPGQATSSPSPEPTPEPTEALEPTEAAGEAAEADRAVEQPWPGAWWVALAAALALGLTVVWRRRRR